ncbi:DUF3597 domain-containing protein [Orbaceae bacterium ac157xtp]
MSILNSIISKVFPNANAQSTMSNVMDKIKDKAEDVKDGVKEMVQGGKDKVEQAVGNKTSGTNFDVVSYLKELAQKSSEKLNWETSIVDLLKLLGLDSSLDARIKLAKELNYTGNTDDTATMNKWLIKEVMKRIAEKGGNVSHLFS